MQHCIRGRMQSPGDIKRGGARHCVVLYSGVYFFWHTPFADYGYFYTFGCGHWLYFFVSFVDMAHPGSVCGFWHQDGGCLVYTGARSRQRCCTCAVALINYASIFPSVISRRVCVPITRRFGRTASR